MRNRVAALMLVPLLAACAPGTGERALPTVTTVPMTAVRAATGTTTATTGGTTAPSTTTATTTASSTTAAPPTDACGRVAFDVGRVHPSASQVIVVLAPKTSANSATLQMATLTARGWSCGAAMTARLGRNGVRPLQDRRSGDDTTPAGVFPLGVMTAWDGQQFSFFGNSADPGVSAGAYRRVRPGDCFGAAPHTAAYGHLVQRAAVACTNPNEYLAAVAGAYEHAALIGANMEPNVSGDAPGEIPYAAAIFLHRFSFDAHGASKPTSGCVSLSHADLVSVLLAMRPGVLFAIGTEEWLRTTIGEQ